MGNQWQQKYLLEYNELVSNFPSPERVVSDYIKNCFKTDLPWFSRIDPDNAYFICFSQTGVIADLILDGIILGNIKQKY